ncbi:MAG: GNAT family N-acetyltransferase [Euzebyales bacterium]|nr:GNAT family N-acetyltransferase [Euzebyales bacterium]MBA3621074.1 GNAT family N-acetyltransferase [Euzebyales bacterium]
MPKVRPPKKPDAPALGSLHVRAWQRAYRGGLMPDRYLDELSADERTQMWVEALQRDPRPRFSRFVVEDHGGMVVGFIAVGPATDPASEDAEVYALNVDPDVWSSGFGTALLDAGTDALRRDGFAEAVLWVHRGNRRARRFYEAAGWVPDGKERLQEVLGVQVPEVRYRRSLDAEARRIGQGAADTT